MLLKRIGNGNVFCCALAGAKSGGRPSPNAARPTGACIGLRLLRTIVRWPLTRPTLNNHLGEHNDWHNPLAFLRRAAPLRYAAYHLNSYPI
jgi:hypothetical protein